MHRVASACAELLVMSRFFVFGILGVSHMAVIKIMIQDGHGVNARFLAHGRPRIPRVDASNLEF